MIAAFTIIGVVAGFSVGLIAGVKLALAGIRQMFDSGDSVETIRKFVGAKSHLTGLKFPTDATEYTK